MYLLWFHSSYPFGSPPTPLQGPVQVVICLCWFYASRPRETCPQDSSTERLNVFVILHAVGWWSGEFPMEENWSWDTIRLTVRSGSLRAFRHIRTRQITWQILSKQSSRGRGKLWTTILRLMCHSIEDDKLLWKSRRRRRPINFWRISGATAQLDQTTCRRKCLKNARES